MGELVWWLIAIGETADAMRLLDGLCELDDEYYWMFQALASSFAARAWLHELNQRARTQGERDAQTAAALADSRAERETCEQDGSREVPATIQGNGWSEPKTRPVNLRGCKGAGCMRFESS